MARCSGRYKSQLPLIKRDIVAISAVADDHTMP
jgi:hypothetical protein